MKILIVTIFTLAIAAGAKAEDALKARFKPLYEKFGQNSKTKVEIVSGPTDVKMRNGGVSGKRWIATSEKHRFKLTIQDSTGFKLIQLVELLQKIPGPYMRACAAVSDEGEDGIAIYAKLGGARAHGGKGYINLVPRADALVIAHEVGHTLEQVYRESDPTILERWEEAIQADKVSVSDYGDRVRHEDLGEFAQVYAVCLDQGSQHLADLKKLSPARFALWEKILKGPKPYWPQFHGPRRNNISDERGQLKEWPEKGPDLVWTAKGLGHGFSSISTADGIIYTAGNIEKDTVITALDLKGKILWQVKNGRAWTKSHPGSRGTPTIDGDRVYHQSPIGNLVCLDARTGKRAWQVNTIKKFKSKNCMWALAESLLIDGNHVISCPGGPETCMVALNKISGELVWKAPSTGELAGYCSPLLVEQKGLRIIITLTAKAIIGVHADTGELLWRVKHVSYADENVMTPIFHDGHVFVSTLAAGSVKWKLNIQNSEAKLEEVWRTKELDNHHGGVVLFNGNLYGTSTVQNRNLWVCLDWKTGKKKSMTEGVGKGSLTCAGGMLYTLSIDRKMGLARPTASGFEMVSTFEIPKGGKGRSWAHPVVCGGRLYIRHGDFLYVYRVK